MSNVKSEFYNVKHVNSEFTKEYTGTWYYVKVNPIPIKEELIKVVSDLMLEKKVHITPNCKVEHYDECGNPSHHVDRELKKILMEAPDEFFNQEYTLMIKAPYLDMKTGQNVLNGQPLVFVINPYINFDSYPDHPHINGYSSNLIPTTICYTGDYEFFKHKSMDEKVVYAVQQSTIWLLKHAIWVFLKIIKYHSPWIAPAGDVIPPESKIDFLNLNGVCMCGSNKPFKDCCLKPLFVKRFNRTLTQPIANEIQKIWERHNAFEKEFRDYFMSIIDKLESSK